MIFGTTSDLEQVTVHNGLPQGDRSLVNELVLLTERERERERKKGEVMEGEREKERERKERDREREGERYNMAFKQVTF